ncbi:hypothetical protein ABH940_006711 [Streptacidiphilus sp. BW17]
MHCEEAAVDRNEQLDQVEDVAGFDQVDQSGYLGEPGRKSAEVLLRQVADARSALATAVAIKDPVGVSRALDELEEALREAREGGVEVPPLASE